MADLRTGDMRRDCRGVPWSSVRDVEHCPVCRGALPADVPSACSTCGPTARGRGDGAPIYPQAVERERLARLGMACASVLAEVRRIGPAADALAAKVGRVMGHG